MVSQDFYVGADTGGGVSGIALHDTRNSQINPEHLTELMKLSQPEFSQALEDRFGGLLELCRSLKTSLLGGVHF